MAILKRKKPLPSSPKKEPKSSKTGIRKDSHILKDLKKSPTKKTLETLKSIKKQDRAPSLASSMDFEPISNLDPLAAKASLQQQLEDIRSQAHHALEEELYTLRQQRLQELEAEKQSLFEQAHQQGFEAGQQKGYGELEPQLERVLAAINTIAEEKYRIFEEAKPELLSLSLAIAEKIINVDLSENHEHFMHIVDDALYRITDKDKVVIRTHPTQARIVRAHQDDILKRLPDIKNLEIQEDHKIEPGGCVIETKMGYVDSSIDMKLDTLQKVLFKSFEEDAHVQ
jgi:flagellar assembly protein FliH